MKRRSYIVSGKVQGVWFRARTKEEADNLQISGFVENREDGTVYTEAQGDEEDLSWFLDWLSLGPPQARVEEVEANDMDIVEGEEGFFIR